MPKRDRKLEVKIKLLSRTVKALKAKAKKEKMPFNDYVESRLFRFMTLEQLGYIAIIEDFAWGRLAEEATKEGFLSAKETETFLEKIMPNKKKKTRKPNKK